MPNGLPMIKNNEIQLNKGKKVYFASDQHFGLDMGMPSRQREKIFVTWLDQIKQDAGAVFILGDMFDAWFEYKYAVPKGFVRVLGKLAELTDQGIQVYFMTGNHDMWMRDYLKKELNIPVYFNAQQFIINNHHFLIGHGDGLGPGDHNYKRLKKLFTNPLARFLFRWLHPDLGLPMIKYFSQKNKLISGEYDAKFKGEDKERLFLYAKTCLQKNPEIDFFIFGHRHLPLKMPLDDKTTYFNTGDWLKHFSFLVYDGQQIHLQYLNK